MRNLLTILASVSILVCAGCASNGDGSAKSPWSAGASASKAKTASASSYAPASVKDADVCEASAEPVDGDASVAAVAGAAEAPLLADYPALRQANKEKAMAEIEAAKSDSEALPTPDEGKARVVAYNVDCSLVQFDTNSAFKVGEKVVLSKSGAHALVQIVVAQEGGRYVAEEVDGVVDAPTLVPGDEIDCCVWVNPEDIKAVEAAAAKAKPQDSGDALDAVEEEEEYSDEEEEYSEEEGFEE